MVRQLTNTERADRRAFERIHDKVKCYTWISESDNTGIGSSVIVWCGGCDRGRNITDYSRW
jgi:hypothetical protein